MKSKCCEKDFILLPCCLLEWDNEGNCICDGSPFKMPACGKCHKQSRPIFQNYSKEDETVQKKECKNYCCTIHYKEEQKGWEDLFDTNFVNDCSNPKDSLPCGDMKCNKHYGYLEAVKDFIRKQIKNTRKEERENCIDKIEDYKKFAEKLHEDSHKDNLNMLLYDAHSRIIACNHILKSLNQ